MAPKRTKLVKLTPILLPNTLAPEAYLMGGDVSVPLNKKIVSHKDTSGNPEPVIVKKKIVKKKDL